MILLTIPCILYGRNFNVMDFGARGNGISDDAIAIQKAVDACTNAGGGDVVFSANHTFLSGPVQLKSNVNIVLETNSVWKANPDESIFCHSFFLIVR
ncbi:MAG: glycosyl hydrolase family 28-related protein [Prevotella sp.]|nr:glycosyl hydrolase family 28-related protein [Prevotella sp.]